MEELQPSGRTTATGRNTTVREPSEGIGVTSGDRAVATTNCRHDKTISGPTGPHPQTTAADAVRRFGCYRSETKRPPTRLVGGRSNGWSRSVGFDSCSLGRQADFAEFRHHQEIAACMKKGPHRTTTEPSISIFLRSSILTEPRFHDGAGLQLCTANHTNNVSQILGSLEISADGVTQILFCGGFKRSNGDGHPRALNLEIWCDRNPAPQIPIGTTAR